MNIKLVANENTELKHFAPEQILSGLENLVKSERRITHLVLKFIHEVQRRKLHLDLGYDSVYKYLTQHLKYSGNQAYDRIDAARVLGASPKISSKIESGQITLSQLVKVGQCLKQEQKLGRDIAAEQIESILTQVENLSVFETEKALARALNYTPKKFQKIRPQQDGSVIVTMTLDNDQYELIQKVQSYISHSVPSNDLAEAFAFLAKKEVRRVEGKAAVKGGKETYTSGFSAPEIHENSILKSNTPAAKKTEIPYAVPAENPTRGFLDFRLRRKFISLRTRRRLMQNADHRCQHVHELTGRSCGSRFQLQVDHVVPLSCGGSEDLQNLRVLCGIHNREVYTEY